MVIPITKPVIGATGWGVTNNAALDALAAGAQPLDADLTAIAALVDPNADRILFWDDSANTWTFLSTTTPLTITGTVLSVNQASTTAPGVVLELATGAEAVTGTDPDRAVTPLALASVVAAEVARADLAYPTQLQQKVDEFLGRLEPIPALPAVMSSPPTVTYITARTLTARQVQPPLTTLPKGSTFDNTNGKTYVGNATIYEEFDFYGDAIEIGWVEQAVNSASTWIFIDGQPVTANPQTTTDMGLSTSAGGFYYTKIVFGSVGLRRITVYHHSVNALLAIGMAATHFLQAAPVKPTMAIVGDSWVDGAAPSGDGMFAFPIFLGMQLGCFVNPEGIGGTGYQSGSDFFGSTSRKNKVIGRDPDIILFVGARNDSSTGEQTAVTNTLAGYRTALPNTPQIVAGIQPGDSSDTISANFAAINLAVRTAALAEPNCVGFIDMLGAVATPAAYSVGTTYNEGDIVSYQGSIWIFRNNGVSKAGPAGTPGTSQVWLPRGFALTGTGHFGATTGDGNRDIFLGSASDSVHLTQAGHKVFARYLATEVLRVLQAKAEA